MKKTFKPLCTVKAAFVLPASFVFFLSNFTFVSCKENVPVEETGEIYTLREDAKILEATTEWAVELEGDVLTRRIDRIEGIDTSRTLLNVASAIAIKNSGKSEKVYPYLEGFSSLDLTSFNYSSEQDCRKLVDDFCKAFCEKKSLDEFFDKDSVFSLVSFIDDLNKKCAVKYFEETEKTDIPEKADSSKSESDKKSETNADKTEKYISKKSKAPDFSSKIGTPVNSEDYFFVPVRFTGSKKIIDVELCLEKKENWKITEISLKKWENKVK